MCKHDLNALGAHQRALDRILAELCAGLRHGYFSFTVTCELIDRRRRRLVLHVGKNYQFVIEAAECEAIGPTGDRRYVGAQRV